MSRGFFDGFLVFLGRRGKVERMGVGIIGARCVGGSYIKKEVPNGIVRS
jgi:hypothetical protein